MRLKTQIPRPPKIQEKRRGSRMNSRVPVVLEWEGAAGEKLSEQVFTRIVGPYGCMVVLPQEISMEQRVQVINRATEQALSGVVVWKGNLGSDGWELGIELSQPPMDFWGLEL
jgi:hypothetical protein